LLRRTAELALKVTSLIDCGRAHDEAEKMFTMGANFRITELQAALANVALERFPAQVSQRIDMAAFVDETLSEVPGVRVLKRNPRHATRSFYRYIFAIDPAMFGVDHNAVCYALEMEGIPCWVGYKPCIITKPSNHSSPNCPCLTLSLNILISIR